MMRVLTPVLLAAIALPIQDSKPAPSAPSGAETVQGEKLSQQEQDQARKLLDQLGSPDFEERREAARQLEKMGPKVLPLLEKAADGAEDSEVRWQARRLIRRLQGGKAETLDREPAPGVERGESAPRARSRARGDQPPGIEDLREQMQQMQEEMRRTFRDMKRLHGFDFDLPELQGLPFSNLPGSQQGESTSIQITPDGVRVETKTTKDGKEDKKVYEAPDMETLLRDHPELKGKVSGWSAPRAGVWRFDRDGVGGFDFDRVFPGGNFRYVWPHGGFHVRLTPEGLRVERDDAAKGETPKARTGKLEKDGRGADVAPEAEAPADQGPKLGIYVRDAIPDGVRDYLGLDKDVGLWVEDVAPDSLAQKLGLAKGDIVTKLNGRTIRSRVDVVKALENAREAKCEYVRKGETKNAEAKVEGEAAGK